MGDPESERREILARPVSIDQEEAERRVQDRLVAKVKQVYTEQTPVRSVLRYKPYYEFETTLRKSYFLSDDYVRDGAIIVDGLTGVTRPILDEDVDVSPQRVEDDAVIETSIDVEEARNEAQSRRMQIEHREKGDLELNEEARLVYKPVWIVELANGEVNVVDADDGRVVSDEVMG